MKKLLSCLLIALLLVSFSATAFASSPETPVAPAVVAADDAAGEDVTNAIVITPYGKKDTLPTDAQEEMDEAYKALNEAEDIAELNDELKAAAGDAAVAVADLFYVSVEEGAEVSFPVDLTLTSKDLEYFDKLESFVGVIRFVDGEWKLMKSSLDGDKLNMTAEDVGTYATIVLEEDATSAKTGELIPYGSLLGAVVLATAAAWFFIKSRKVKA